MVWNDYKNQLINEFNQSELTLMINIIFFRRPQDEKLLIKLLNNSLIYSIEGYSQIEADLRGISNKRVILLQSTLFEFRFYQKGLKFLVIYQMIEKMINQTNTLKPNFQIIYKPTLNFLDLLIQILSKRLLITQSILIKYRINKNQRRYPLKQQMITQHLIYYVIQQQILQFGFLFWHQFNSKIILNQTKMINPILSCTLNCYI
ncbi:unnamed protein product [Paramecium primaurelia]|uniref:Uncharacterized protein n=1 Tax=Paramecium primaurelia TaxID=5886 RepID=A0A8S1MZG9_PARPR|nr:unnamed protein product [Paramecium primaurelia]